MPNVVDLKLFIFNEMHITPYVGNLGFPKDNNDTQKEILLA